MKKLLSALALLFFCSTLALASGSSGGSGVPSGGSKVDPYTVTETMKCIVTQILANGQIVVTTRDRKQLTLAITENTKFVSKGRSLRVTDVEVGHKLKIVTRGSGGEVLRVRIIGKR